MSVGRFVSEARHRFQGELFPFLAEGGPLGERPRRFVAARRRWSGTCTTTTRPATPGKSASTPA